MAIDSTSQPIEKRLWDAAVALRTKLDPSENKHVVLGLIFLKYVSDRFALRQRELRQLVDDPASDYFMPTEGAKQSILEDRDEYLAENVFWVPPGARWSDLRAAAKQQDIGTRIDDAMLAIERENRSLQGVLPKNYARRELDAETLGGLIDVFSRADLAAEEDKDLDVLGRVYEYFLGQFAGGEGKRGGQYYTPRSVVALLVEILQPYKGRVYDPACGSGGMFVQADKFVRAHGGVHNDLSVFGQESVATTWRLAKMNLAIRGIEANLGDQWGDTFHENKHADTRFDFVIANPPFNVDDWGGDRLRDDHRWSYGAPPARNANFAWLQHMLHQATPTGTVACLLANGSLTSTQNGEGEIRQRMVDGDVVEAIIALPAQMFYNVQIPVCIWILTKGKQGTANGTRDRCGETLFIDARKLGYMETRTVKTFTDADRMRVADAYHAWRGTETSNGQTYEDVAGFCRSVNTSEIAEHQYMLTPGRYVGSEAVEEDGEPIEDKIQRLSDEIREGFAKRAALQGQVLLALDGLEDASV